MVGYQGQTTQQAQSAPRELTTPAPESLIRMTNGAAWWWSKFATVPLALQESGCHLWGEVAVGKNSY